MVQGISSQFTIRKEENTMFASEASRLITAQRKSYGAISPDGSASTITHRGSPLEVSAPATTSKFLSRVWDRITSSSTQRRTDMSVVSITAHAADTPDRLALACFSKIIEELPERMRSEIQPKAKRKYCKDFNAIYAALMRGIPEFPYQFAASLANNLALWTIERSLPAPSQGTENPKDGRSQLAPWMVQNMLTVVCENLGFNEDIAKAYEERIFGEKADATTEGPVMTVLRGVLTEAGIGRYKELKASYAAARQTSQPADGHQTR
jgi:hypothetical protein